MKSIRTNLYAIFLSLFPALELLRKASRNQNAKCITGFYYYP